MLTSPRGDPPFIHALQCTIGLSIPAVVSLGGHLSVLIAFITGLTAGSLGCLAVQGGLLTGSLAHQLNKELKQASPRAAGPGGSFRPRAFLPISLFLLAKLLAYTLLGLLLGTLGSLLQLTPLARALLTMAIGVFMLGNGLRMLGAHQAFRWFVLEPPSRVARFLRRASKDDVSRVTPVVLGTLTVLLPCGVAQTVMAAALASGAPLKGAALLFAFTLGTTPVFFAATYGAFRLGATIERSFTRLIALTLMALGVVSLVYGANLTGISAPFFSHLQPSPAPRAATGTAAAAPYTVSVSEKGYRPRVLHLPAGRPVTLLWVTSGPPCCSQSVVLPALDYQKILPAKGAEPLTIPPQVKGTVLGFSCGTGRNSGQLVFDVTAPDGTGNRLPKEHR